MIAINTTNALEMLGTNRLICLEGLRRGWQIAAPRIPGPFLYVTLPDGRQCSMYSSTHPATTFARALVVDDKYATYQLLKDSGIRQLDTILLDMSDDITSVEEFIAKYGRIVVKPIDGGHGNGVTVNVDTVDKLRVAIEYAMKYSGPFARVIAQEQFTADRTHDLRVLCIDGKFVAAIERVPARVWGDGEHTVGALIDIENAQAYRGRAYREKLTTISKDRAAAYLGDAIDRIPERGEEVSVLGVVNYGAGGETVDVTDDVPEWLRDEAERAARALELEVVGIDFMTDRRLAKDVTSSECQAVIIEVNKSPALLIHEEPTTGKSRNVVATYLDSIESIENYNNL